VAVQYLARVCYSLISGLKRGLEILRGKHVFLVFVSPDFGSGRIAGM
jgi:hypothetical protein